MKRILPYIPYMIGGYLVGEFVWDKLAIFGFGVWLGWILRQGLYWKLKYISLIRQQRERSL